MTVTFDFSGRAALVTGAGAGFGFAITEALAKAGASVCAVDINPDRCDRLLEAVQAAGAQAVAFHGDVSNRFQAAAPSNTPAPRSAKSIRSSTPPESSKGAICCCSTSGTGGVSSMST
ncbi:MAG: short chain dehydrogenase/reductase oxidoreductase [Chloroflexi bacterium OLB13]|nr:MAG: short chain dehydrogenase/reductase oxidoreductase [Chloroflexi bacterium OLB13]